MKVIYRISDVGYKKDKPEYINNEKCLFNAVKVFPIEEYDWVVIGDNLSSETSNMVKKYIPESQIKYVSVGNGAGTFKLAIDLAVGLPEDELVYFLENDYVHKERSGLLIEEGLKIADYVTLYDHPDKYINGANPEVSDGGEVTRLIRSDSIWWKLTNSTTMTFASKVDTLKKDYIKISKFIEGTYPRDFDMFIALRDSGRSLISPIPSYSTHGEKMWLSYGDDFVEDREAYWKKNIFNPIK